MRVTGRCHAAECRLVTVDALQDRQQLVSASRVVVKVGSSSLTDARTAGSTPSG